MTAQERALGQQQESSSALRTQRAEKSAQLDAKQKPDQAGSVKTLARSVGNSAMAGLMAAGREGTPLDPGFRGQMERALGADLSEVRLHDDAAAQASASGMGASAFTRGEDVFLANEASGLEDAAREQLLAHEVVHVVQQRKAGVVSNQVSQPGDTHEREADHASHAALSGQSVSVGGGGVAPATQRQVSGGGITKKFEANTASRAEVKQAILDYLQKAQAAQGGSLRDNQAVKTALLTLTTANSPGLQADPQKVFRYSAMEGVLAKGSTDPEDLASRAAQVLPDPFDRSALARLQRTSVKDSEKPKLEQIKDLAEKNFKKPEAPAGQPPSPAKEQEDLLNKLRADHVIPSPKGFGIGPASVDVLGLGRTLAGIEKILKPNRPAAQRPSVPGANVEPAISKIPNDSLLPAEARGAKDTGDFANAAQDVARELAGKIEAAQRKGQESVELRFADAYNGVKDRAAMVDAVVSLVKAVRDALPNHGSPVKFVDVYFGNRLVTRNVAEASP